MIHFSNPFLFPNTPWRLHCARYSSTHAIDIPLPQVTIIGSDPRDEFMVLASDGLWDVMSDEEVTALARKCLRRSKERVTDPEIATRATAQVLIWTAVDKGCRDNITVTIIDLSCGR